MQEWGDSTSKAFHKNRGPYFYFLQISQTERKKKKKHTERHTDTHTKALTDHILLGGMRIILPFGENKYLANNCTSWHQQDSCWKMLILHIVHSIAGEVTAL